VQDESRWPVARLAEIRTKEMAEALQVIGVKNHHWLGYPDGGCQHIPDRAAVEQIAKYIHTYQPDTILTFGPDGMTGHPDHQTVSRWVSLAVKESDQEIAIYHAVQPKERFDQMRKA